MRWINPSIDIDGERLHLDSPLSLSLIGTTAAILAGTLAAAGTSAVAGVVGSRAAGKAAKTQSDSTLEAARLQDKTTNRSLDLQKSIFDQGREDIAPWMEAGRKGLATMSDLLAKPGEGLLKGYDKTFEAPGTVTDEDVKKQFDPGFQYRMDLSNKALQSFAASKGLLDSGGTAMKLIRNAQDLGSQEYQGAFGRAETLNQQQYSRALDTFNTNAGTFYKNQENEFSRLAQLSGVGERVAGADAQLGENYGRSVAGVAQSGTTATNELNTSGAAAGAAGTVGGANAWSAALANIGKALSNYGPMQGVFGGGDPSRFYGYAHG